MVKVIRLRFRMLQFFNTQARQQGVVGCTKFLATTKRFKHELAPRFKILRKAQRGRVPVRTGSSIKGNDIEFGDYGLRLKSEGIRLKAIQFKEAQTIVMKYMRKVGGQMWTRMACNIPVFVKGNETRMGKGKGSFSHWMARVPTGKVLLEIGGEGLHETIAKEAFRKANVKLPGNWEFVKKGDPIRVSLTHKIAEKPAPINYSELQKKNPNRKLANILKSQEPMYKMYRNR